MSRVTLASTQLLLGAVMVVGLCKGADEERGSGAAARISDVAWIAGRWSLDREDGRLEEVWSEPAGDCMMGMFRWLKEGRVWIYEMLTIREEAGTLVLRFRHFSESLVAWEPKEEPLTYRLTRVNDTEAVFENPESESHRMYAFRRVGENELLVRVGAVRNGEVRTSDFAYRRR